MPAVRTSVLDPKGFASLGKLDIYDPGLYQDTEGAPGWCRCASFRACDRGHFRCMPATG